MVGGENMRKFKTFALTAAIVLVPTAEALARSSWS
jgi:hypothetical protein